MVESDLWYYATFCFRLRYAVSYLRPDIAPLGGGCAWAHLGLLGVSGPLVRPLYLASASPRRLDLLRQIGIEPIVVPSSFLEREVLWGNPEHLAREYALGKARGAFFAHLEVPSDSVIIGADTVVALKGEIFGKPRDREHASHMLQRLSGRTHEVFSGVAIVRPNGQYLLDSACTEVTFRELCKQEIAAYVATAEPLDKAGAYGIQGRGALLVESIRGCYTNVVGLPLTKLNGLLRQWDVEVTQAWR